MKQPRNYRHWTVPGLLCFVAVSCAAPRQAAGPRENFFAAPSDLTATLATPVDIDLHWKNCAASPACYFVEFALEQHPQESDFTMLNAFWPDMTRFRHDHVAPETHFVYRVRPLFGQASAVAVGDTDVPTLPLLSAVSHVKGDRSPLPSPEVEGPLDLPETTDATAKQSIRNPVTAADGVPAGLTATPVFSTAVDLHWQDRAMDEDGYLVDISTRPTNDFHLCALLPPDTTSFRKSGLSAGSKYYFRVRAFFYGKPSNQAEIVSGRDPADGNASDVQSISSYRPALITVEKR